MEEKAIHDQLKDHEDRLRTLEKNYMETKFNLINIEKGQSELKLMMSENKQDNRQIFSMLERFIDSDIDTKKVSQKNLWDLIFKVWAVLAPVIATIAAIYKK